MAVDVRLSYSEARRRILDEFERAYVVALLRAHGDNVSKAARAAGVSRVYLHRLLQFAHDNGLACWGECG